MKKLLFLTMLLSVFGLVGCASYPSSTTKEPIEMFMFSQHGRLFVFTAKDSFELQGPAVSDLWKFLNSPHTKVIEKVQPTLNINEKDRTVYAQLSVYVRVDNLTEKQRNELLNKFMFTPTPEEAKKKLQQDYGISPQFDIYDTGYVAEGVIRQYENRDELLAKHKLAKPIMATVHRNYEAESNCCYSDEPEMINPLVILVAPLWFPLAMLDCLNERSGFLDFCPFR